MGIRVFHCDDSLPFRALVREVLDGEDDLDLVGFAADGEAAVSEVAEARPDELAALLALHPGSDTAGAAASLGVPVETLAWIMQGFEAWLGAPGRPALVPDGGGHALGDADVDWQRLRDLIGPAVATADSADMRQAPPATTIQWRALPAAGVGARAGSGAGAGVMASL